MSQLDIIRKRIITQYKKALNKIGIDIKVYRPKLNEYKEAEGFELYLNFIGISSKSNIQTTKSSADKGSIKRQGNIRFQCIIDENTKSIKEGYMLETNGEQYSVIDKTDVNMLGALYDIVVEKV